MLLPSVHLSELQTLSKLRESKRRLFQREEMNGYCPGTVGACALRVSKVRKGFAYTGPPGRRLAPG